VRGIGFRSQGSEVKPQLTEFKNYAAVGHMR
jgi:hypothetical protein